MSRFFNCGTSKIFCSTIIPTVARTSLNRAVHSVLSQDVEHFEVIVVNDSGSILPETDWMADPRVRVLNTNRRERSVARNTGAACANGEYLHFLDDDDWLLPGAFSALKELIQHNKNATWYYGATQLVDREHKPIIHLRHGLTGNCFTQIMAGEWIPLQSSFIPAEVFFNLRGFLPGLSSMQDVDLCRRAALAGDFAETEKLFPVSEWGKWVAQRAALIIRNIPGGQEINSEYATSVYPHTWIGKRT
ncbi:MAG: glycosyltransferase [Anaerolineae bacterium]|nr:glycosyltransferase [Anaerolineae bacterium]